MKKKTTKTSNLFTPTGEAIPWEEATRETLLKRIMIAPLRFVCGIPPKRLFGLLLVIEVVLFGVHITLLLCGFAANKSAIRNGISLMVFPLIVLATMQSKAFIWDTDSHTLNQLSWTTFSAFRVVEGERYFFSRLSPISILRGHKDSKHEFLAINSVIFSLSTYAKLERGANEMEFMNDPRVTDAVCRILYAEMQIDKVTAYALEILGAAKNTDKPTTTKYQNIITQYKIMRNTAILELKDHVEQQNQETRRREYLRNALTASRA